MVNVFLYRDGATIVSANYKNEHWDIIIDFSYYVAKEGRSYFCAICCNRKDFATKDELYTEHNFEPLLSWLIENLKTENWLHLLGNKNVRFVKINNVSPDELSKDYVFSTRLILDKKDARSE